MRLHKAGRQMDNFFVGFSLIAQNKIVVPG
jgi:hypothetical protein